MTDGGGFFEKYWWIFGIAAYLTFCTDTKNDGISSDKKQLVTASSGASRYVTTRGDPPEYEDDPTTTNDESNDQPLGYYGSKTLCVFNDNSGNTYTLDVDLSEEREVEQIYFPKGGWLYFSGCELDEDFYGSCADQEGDGWQFQGEC